MIVFESVPGEPVAVMRHPPERRGAPLVLACGGCGSCRRCWCCLPTRGGAPLGRACGGCGSCCCCCCCLHTVGALLATAIASGPGPTAPRLPVGDAPVARAAPRAPTRALLRCRKCGEIGAFEWTGPAGEK